MSRPNMAVMDSDLLNAVASAVSSLYYYYYYYYHYYYYYYYCTNCNHPWGS